MTNIKKVFCEEEVTNLQKGDLIMINENIAMRRNKEGDGMNYFINNKDGTGTIINLRGYHLINGNIIPVWYSEKMISLKNTYLRGGK